jgi:signal transduction histidine kinase
MTAPHTPVSSERVLRVLLIEDNPADVDLIKEALDEADLSVTIHAPQVALEHVPRLAEGLARLGAADIDIVLLDLSLPDSQGFETFVRLEQAASGIPTIVLSGLADEALAVRAVREGAQDYLVKGQVDGVNLTRSIRYAVERKHAEEERARLARERSEVEVALRARNDVLATITHDLRTPLTSIMGFAQLLRRRLERGTEISPQDLADRLRRIEEQTYQMTRMIDDLLDVSLLDAGRALELRREPCDLVALAQKATSDVQRTTERHRLRVTATEPEIIGILDGARIERVLQNLFSNAVKYSPDGGLIDVTVWQANEVDGRWGVITVRDEGVGIPAADLPRLFERFFRATNVGDRIRGTGIGLAGAHQIVEQHGGRIGVTSEEGVGSTFTVRLPLDEPVPSEDTISSPDGQES